MTERQNLVSNHSDYGSTSTDFYKPPPNPTVLYVSSTTPTICESIKTVLTSSWINILLIFIPLGFLAHVLELNDTLVFTLNFLAIMPLAKLLDFATEDVSLRVGQVFVVNKFSFANKI